MIISAGTITIREIVSRAIDHVDLEVKAGEFIAILGHNGSGKSTLAKHMNAILQPTEGTVWVKGMNTADERTYMGYSSERRHGFSKSR